MTNPLDNQVKPLTLEALKHEYKLNGSGDAWGDAMTFAFALCETLYERDEHDIPELMRFSPGIFGVSDDLEDSIRQDLKRYDTETLESFGRILSRLIDILRASGRSY